ncbi:MAG TPA: T9SS type A sorting domain-containing protein, partial [Candidatus Marinimicrobia bacterium]|nr:T9SS type A sorting domain-containing protein [Candidatus Neomarinimicrobiota bacterium]
EGSNELDFNNGEHSAILYFGKDVAEEHRNSYSLPPTFPQMAFDVRFNGDMKYTMVSGDIEVLNTSDNLTISYDIVIDAGEHMNWVLSSASGSEFILEGSGEITIPIEETFTLERKAIIPIAYTLHQNYPNPFNPITSIRYDLPEAALVTLTIYDLIGREITQLVNTTQEAGYRSVRWDATDSFGKPVSAGVYLYQIRSGGFVQTRKMVLLK